MKNLVGCTCAALLLAMAATASAQSYQGSVRGQVHDSHGIIPGAEVSLLNEATNAGRTAVTNEVGEYVFTSVLPGIYSVRVALEGFRGEERKGVAVGTQQSIVVDFQLEVGALSEQVTVLGQAELIDRSTASVATSLSKDFLQNIPIFGRNTFYAAISAANVVQSGDPQFVRMQDQSGASSLSLGGGPRRGNGYLLEGVPITDLINRATIVPSIEAVSELKIQVKTYDAEMGRAAGGVFNTTAKSGSNAWHGSAVIIDKPQWGTGQLYFAKVAGTPKPKQYYYDWAGSLGGPIVPNRTFFWFSMEGYQQKSTRNNVITFPTAAERLGDFSQTVNASGLPVVVYDPLTTHPDPANAGRYIRDPFPDNRIPADRISPVARAMLGIMPLPASGKAFNGNASLVDGPQDQETAKVDHRWSDRWTTTGMWAHQHTKEPGSAFFGEFGAIPGDPGASLLFRTVDFIAVNNVLVPNSTTTVAVRYGYNRFVDNASNYPAFTAGTLGLPASYVNALTFDTFPRMTINGYGGTPTLGNTGPSNATHFSHNANVVVSKLVGHHTLKAGAEYRRIGADVFSYGSSAGAFTFTPAFTQGPNANAASAAAGDAFASFLLGYPASGEVAVATPAHVFVDYYAGFAQDDYRVTASLSLNYGLRYEFEQGLREGDNRLTVGFDRSTPFPVQVPGMTLKGGLMYAGVDGNSTHQGHPSKTQLAPRGGVAWSLNDRTVVRGGYGRFWAPTQFTGVAESALGTRGYTAVTSYLSSNDGGLTPAGTLTDPFPAGITPPQGSSLGLLTGAGGAVDFIDQEARPGYVQQYSVDIQRELPGGNVVNVGYMGSRSERLSVGGTTDATVNINQLDPQYLALGTALQQLVPNPFYDNPVFGNLSRSATIARGQLLRPFPQFGDILAHRVNAVSARYNALVVKWDRRLHHGWAAGVNYSYGRLKDNQFGETNTYSDRLGQALDNTNLDGEFGYSLLDVPHRLNVNATLELPFGKNRRWMTAGGLADALLGGWSLTLAGRYQNGFPLSIWAATNNSGLFGSTQRPNIVEGVEPSTAGDWEDRLGQWIDSAAWSAAAPFTFGNAPRTDPRVRTPGQATTDLNVQKSVAIGSKTISLRADILNLFDNPLFTRVVTQYGLGTFGQVTQVGGFARSVQFQVRVNW